MTPAQVAARVAAGVAIGAAMVLVVWAGATVADRGYPYTLGVVVLDALAVHRLTRLVTADVLTAPLRAAVYRWAYLRAGHDAELLDGDLDAMVDADMAEDPDGTPRLAYLVRCRWCAGVWLAAAVVAARSLAPAAWGPTAALLALASLGVLLARLEDD